VGAVVQRWLLLWQLRHPRPMLLLSLLLPLQPLLLHHRNPKWQRPIIRE